MNGTCCGIAVDGMGTAYVAGGGGPNLPVKNGPSLKYAGMGDAFVAKVPRSGVGVLYSGYLGGASPDYATGIALDSAGNAYLCGMTWSKENTFPVKVGPDHQYNGGLSIADPAGTFVAKVAETALMATGTSRVGGTVALALLASNDVGLPYQLATSLGTGPILIGNRKLGLSLDDLLKVTVNNDWPWIFSGYRGVIDAKGQAQAAIHIPGTPALIGVRLHSAFATLDASAPLGIKSISDTVSFSITK
jgi:hypothetical protein